MQEVVTIRDASLEIAPSFQASVHETPVNIYRMKVDAQSFDSRRMSWTWRSPGNRLIASPQAFIEFELDCHIPYNFTEAEALSSICGHVDRSAGSIIAGQGPVVNANDSSLAAEIAGGGVAHMRSYGYSGLGTAPNALAGNRDAALPTEIPGSRGYRAGLAYGEGDAVGNCIESIQFTINGCSISHQNWHLFKRSLDRCWIPSRVMQRVYHGAGGSWNAYDCKPLSGQVSRADYFSGKEVLQATEDPGQQGQAAVAGGAPPTVAAQAAPSALSGAPTVEGFTADTGLARRMKNLFASVVGVCSDAEYPSDNTAQRTVYNGSSFKVRIRFPLCGGVFNPCWGESGLSRSCPYQRLALAIPNLNQGALTVLFKDLEKTVIRRLGRTLSKDKVAMRGTLINNSEASVNTIAQTVANNGNAQTATTTDCVPFTCRLSVAKPPALFLTYLRLQAFRRPPEVASFTTFRTQTYLGPQPTLASMSTAGKKALASAFDDHVGAVDYLACDGEQVVSKVSTLASYDPAIASPTREWRVTFENLQFAQPPSYIFICAQKSSDMFSHKTPIQNLSETLDETKNAADLTYATTAAKFIETARIKSTSEATRATPIVANTLTADLNAGNTYRELQQQGNTTNAQVVLNQQSADRVSVLKACGRYIAQNQDANLSITRIDLLVQSSVGSFKLSGDSYPYLRDQQIIWDEHRRNCNTDYFEKSGFSDWKKRGSCVLLSVSQYLHGLGSSAGVAFPIQITAEVYFANKCQFIEGLYAYDEKAPRGPMVFRDCISARPVLVGLFDKQVIQIASSSAVLSAQNLSQASAAQILASRQ